MITLGFGVGKNRFLDVLWHTYGARSMSMSIRDFWLISYEVRKIRLYLSKKIKSAARNALAEPSTFLVIAAERGRDLLESGCAHSENLKPDCKPVIHQSAIAA